MVMRSIEPFDFLSYLERYRIVTFLVSLPHFLFLALLESTEVVLDEESCVKLADRYLVVD